MLICLPPPRRAWLRRSTCPVIRQNSRCGGGALSAKTIERNRNCSTDRGATERRPNERRAAIQFPEVAHSLRRSVAFETESIFVRKNRGRSLNYVACRRGDRLMIISFHFSVSHSVPVSEMATCPLAARAASCHVAIKLNLTPIASIGVPPTETHCVNHSIEI